MTVYLKMIEQVRQILISSRVHLRKGCAWKFGLSRTAVLCAARCGKVQRLFLWLRVLLLVCYTYRLLCCGFSADFDDVVVELLIALSHVCSHVGNVGVCCPLAL